MARRRFVVWGAGLVGRNVPGSRTLEEALARGGADAVVVALPEMLHRHAILAALKAGLRVLTVRPGSLASVLSMLLFSPAAWADHGATGGRASGVSPWVVLAGVLVLLAAVAWALFAPGARDPEPPDPPPQTARDGPSG